VGSFQLLVDPGTGSAARPIRQMNAVLPGQKLIYRPGQLPADYKKSAEIALVLAQENDASEAGFALTVLDRHRASEPGEWDVNKAASIVALVFGPQGLDTKKVASLVKKDRELVLQLADYAEQTAQVESLIETLTAWEDDPSKAKALDAAVTGIAAKSGASVTKLDRTAPTNEQALALMRALNPALTSYDPLTPQTGARFQQSAGLAASVAGLFLGNTVGLAAGGAMLVQNLRTMLFPDTAFRSALVQETPAGGLTLCAKREPFKSRTRLAYLWALRLPNAPRPSLTLTGPAWVPLGLESQIEVKAAEANTWKVLNRARNWQLVSANGKGYLVPVVVIAGQGLSLDLSKVDLPAGTYKLQADWDWDSFVVQGEIRVAPLGDYASVKLAGTSAGKLVTATGPVHATLQGTDFQFLESAAIQKVDDPRAAPQPVVFLLPRGKRAGPQDSVEVEIDTSKLPAGGYHLLLTQSDGKPQRVPLRILPPHPHIGNLPLRANLGETSQTAVLRGTGLDRIESIHCDRATFELQPGGSASERTALVRLGGGVAKGERVDLALKVEGVPQPLSLSGALQILGPRPRITRIQTSLAEEFSVLVREGELPAGSMASFSIQVENLGGEPAIHLHCLSGGQALALHAGDRHASARLESAGQGLLFLSVDPAAAGQPGCELEAAVESAPEGVSDSIRLGRIVRLPRIESFTLTDEMIRPGIYAGILRGEDLEVIEKTGWNPQTGTPVEELPKPITGHARQQTLRIALPWPSPTPHAPLYVWLRGEHQGRKTQVRY